MTQVRILRDQLVPDGAPQFPVDAYFAQNPEVGEDSAVDPGTVVEARIDYANNAWYTNPKTDSIWYSAVGDYEIVED